VSVVIHSCVDTSYDTARLETTTLNYIRALNGIFHDLKLSNKKKFSTTKLYIPFSSTTTSSGNGFVGAQSLQVIG
jgi:hypothetical protein